MNNTSVKLLFVIYHGLPDSSRKSQAVGAIVEKFVSYKWMQLIFSWTKNDRKQQQKMPFMSFTIENKWFNQ